MTDEAYDDLLEELDESTTNFEDEVEQTSLAMFEGDLSTLYPEQRLCLHALLKNRYISAERHPEHWAVLLVDEQVIKGRLNELFLDLTLDREHRIAFKRAATPDGAEPLPSLLRNASHTKEETVVMVALRQRFFAQRQQGDDAVFVDRESLLEEVADRRPEHATDRAMDHKRANNAIDGLATAGILLRTDDPDRFQISPVIEVVLPIERLRALWIWLMGGNGSDPAPSDDGAPEPDLLFETDGDPA